MDHDGKMTILSYFCDFFLFPLPKRNTNLSRETSSCEMKNGESADWIPRLNLYLFM